MWSADKWTEYSLLDSSDGEKLEYWGDYLLRRPDPQAVWSLKSDKNWNKADAWYHRSKSGGGKWQYLNKKLPERWTINYRDLTFNIKPMGFKHTGLFPDEIIFSFAHVTIPFDASTCTTSAPAASAATVAPPV